MLEVKEIRAGYGHGEVLHGVSFRAEKGEITAILGPNGCGKSTLLKTLCAVHPAAAGQVLLEGRDLLTLPPNLLARKVSYLAQGRQIPEITVERLVLHGRFPYLSYPRRYRREDYEIARRVMAQMGILDLAETPLSRLSGGQRQKAYIAMALAQDTEVVLLDEPTTYLDISHQLQFLHQARELADAGKYVLMVIHDIPLALEWADRAVVLQEGAVAAEGTPEAVCGSGCLPRVFGVSVERTQVAGRWRYFCEKEN